MILKMKDPEEAAKELKKWIRWTSVSRLEPFKKLGEKIKRHFDDIINANNYSCFNNIAPMDNPVVYNTIKDYILSFKRKYINPFVDNFFFLLINIYKCYNCDN